MVIAWITAGPWGRSRMTSSKVEAEKHFLTGAWFRFVDAERNEMARFSKGDVVFVQTAASRPGPAIA